MIFESIAHALNTVTQWLRRYNTERPNNAIGAVPERSAPLELCITEPGRVRVALGDYEAFRGSKDPPSFMVLLEDSAALIGILIAAVCMFPATGLNAPVFDDVASIIIGLVLAGTEGLLARESKSLLLGERADKKLNADIWSNLRAD